VTGGSRGIGRAVAIERGRRGATVAVHYAQRVTQRHPGGHITGEVSPPARTRPVRQP
jgi:NAD(P)-dependent dehydrogenase (short-subunit alcohol dehydrogenase family)